MVSHISEQKILSQAQTGDLILCNGRNSFFSSFVEFFTNSKFSHIGIIYKNPDFEIKKQDQDPNNLYLIEANINNETDSLSGSLKNGVELVSLNKFFDSYRSSKNGYLYYRKLHIDRNYRFLQIGKRVILS